MKFKTIRATWLLLSYISHILPPCQPAINSYSWSSSHLIWSTIIGIFINCYRQTFNKDLRYTSCSCLPPYSLYIPSIIWPLPGECPYHVLPTYTGRKGGDWREPGRRNLIIQGRKLYIHILTKRNMTSPDVFAVLCL